MNILVVSQYFWPENFKGNDIAFNLAEKGHNVSVLTAKPNYPEGSFYKGYSFFGKSLEIIRGISIIRVPVLPRRSGSAFHLALNYFSFVFFSYWAFLFRIKNIYDVILVQQLSPVFSALPGIWIRKKYGIKLVLWVLDLWPDCLKAAGNIKSKFMISWVDKIVKRIYNNSDQILISSRSFENSVRSKLIKNIPVTYFPNWAEDIFLNGNITNKINIEFPFGFNIVFAGNIGEANDFESIVKAVKLTQEKGINWIIIGDGRKLPWLKKEIENQKLENIFIKGYHPIDKMPEIFHAADALLVSLKENEVFSLTVPAKIQAYMASGKIILGMLNGEGAEIINQANCGFTVNAGNAEGLAQMAIKISLLSPAEKEKQGMNGRMYYMQIFDKIKLMNQIERILIQSSKASKSK
jgi:glycosyltransferase involved in cell wall biosynthesis